MSAASPVRGDGEREVRDGDPRALSLKHRLGDWFDPDWKVKASTLPAGGWVQAYNEAWREKPDAWVSAEDRECILSWLPGEGLRVLEVGCGGGATAVELARTGHRVTAVDVSDVALKLAAARTRRRAASLTLAQCFMEELPFPDRAFDAVVCCHTLEHARDAARAAAELERVCGGRLIVIVPRQEAERYTEDYHTVFFPGLTALRGLFRLRERTCRLLGDGAALLYVGERAGTPIALPRSGGWSRMDAARAYEETVERAAANLRDADPAAALAMAGQAARLAWINQGDPRFQEDPRLEEILSGVAWSAFGVSGREGAARGPAARERGGEPRVGFVISHALDTGGHLRTLSNLVDCLTAGGAAACDPRIYSTETADSAQTGAEWLAALESRSVPLWRAPAGAPPLEQARALRAALARDRRELVALFIHPDDVVAGAATRFLPGAATAFFHHAANAFTVGGSAADAHVDYLEGLRAHCDACRRLPNRIVLQLPGPDPETAERALPASRAALGIPARAPLSFTAAAAYKFFRDGDRPYFDALARILREEPGLHHVCIGYAAEGHLGQIEAFAREHRDVMPRVHFLPKQGSLLPWLRAADLVLDSFPLGGGNVALEAMCCGVPVVTLRERGPLPEGPWEMVGLPECVARSAGEYVAKALALARDPALRRETGGRLRARYAERHSPGVAAERWRQAFVQLHEARGAWRCAGESPGAVGEPDGARVESGGGGVLFKVSVLLAAGDEIATTGETLEALSAHAPEDAAYELVVVDNASRDETAGWLATLEGDVQVLTLDAPRSAAAALNAAARRARGTSLLFLANGSLAHPGWFEGASAGGPADEPPAGGPALMIPRARFLAAGGLAEDAPLEAAFADLRIRAERAQGGAGARALAAAAARGLPPDAHRWLERRWAGLVPADVPVPEAVVHSLS